MPVLTIENGAHHADSFLPFDTDDTYGPGSNIKETRAQIEKYLNKWMNKYKQSNIQKYGSLS